MAEHILAALEKARQLLNQPQPETLYIYPARERFEVHSVAGPIGARLAAVVLRGHEAVSSISIQQRKAKRTRVLIVTPAGCDTDRVSDAMQAVKTALEQARFTVVEKPGHAHYYFVRRKVTPRRPSSALDAVARFSFNPRENHFELEVFDEHAEAVINAVFNKRAPALPVNRTLFPLAATAAR